MKILFHSNQLSLRGTEVALYDYAHYNEKILNNNSIIAYNRNSIGNDLRAIEKFVKRFDVFDYENLAELEKIVDTQKVDKAYFITAGKNDNTTVKSCETLIHAVFPQKTKYKYGDRYAFVSEWLSKICSRGKTPFIPHIVELPPPTKNLRADLGIGEQALVFGGYGGDDSFDISCAIEAIRDALDLRKDIVFLFMNFLPFIQHERVIFLPGNSDPQIKANFISSCDAMLHARKLGESFGLACGEFSILNKPILTYSKSKHNCHLMILGDKALTYKNKKELVHYLINLDKKWLNKQNWDCYSSMFNCEAVMKKFHDVYIADLPPKEENIFDILRRKIF